MNVRVAEEQKIGVVDAVQFGFPKRHRAGLGQIFVKRLGRHGMTRHANRLVQLEPLERLQPGEKLLHLR